MQVNLKSRPQWKQRFGGGKTGEQIESSLKRYDVHWHPWNRLWSNRALYLDSRRLLNYTGTTLKVLPFRFSSKPYCLQSDLLDWWGTAASCSEEPFRAMPKVKFLEKIIGMCLTQILLKDFSFASFFCFCFSNVFRFTWIMHIFLLQQPQTQRLRLMETKAESKEVVGRGISWQDRINTFNMFLFHVLQSDRRLPPAYQALPT